MRTVFLLSALFLSSSLAFCPPPTIHTFKLGNFRGTVLSDGPLIFNLSIFSAPKEVVRAARRRDFVRDDVIRISQNVLLLDTPHARIMFDAGSDGLQDLTNFTVEAGRLFENMRAAGVATDSVDAIVLTHGHLDHVYGLADREGKKRFGKAKVYVGKKEHTYWKQLLERDENDLIARLYMRSVLPYDKTNSLVLVKDGESPLKGVTFIPVNGHSPGHNVFEVVSGKERMIISGDTWGTKSDTLRFPKWNFFGDFDFKQTVRSRKKLLRRLVRERLLTLSYHEAFPGLGYVRRRGQEFEWVDWKTEGGYGVGLVCRA